jgi:molecular chaperone DnaK (HSP70)
MSLLIKRLKEVATAKNHGQEVSHVVAGVPAYFTHAQREATKQAFQLAGLEVVRMIDEPTAAGYAFKYECTDSTIIFILDIGQGTSDAVVMETNAEKREIQTIAKGGDNELGGDHFTNAIGEVIKKQIVFGELSSCSLAQIRNAADDIKRNICEEDPEM